MNKLKLNLPRKDKYGNPYLSYSQINLFKKNKEEYLKQYIKNEPFIGNAYTDFGSKVGQALETNCYDGFTADECDTLKKCVRLDEFEKQVILKYDNFYVVGYIDTNSKDLNHIIDYKTGSLNKYQQYQEEDYTQLCYYALSLRQEYGVTPIKAHVNFIERNGNPYKGESLSVGSTVMMLDVDISYNRLKKVYWETISIAREIEKVYKKNK